MPEEEKLDKVCLLTLTAKGCFLVGVGVGGCIFWAGAHVPGSSW